MRPRRGGGLQMFTPSSRRGAVETTIVGISSGSHWPRGWRTDHVPLAYARPIRGVCTQIVMSPVWRCPMTLDGVRTYIKVELRTL